MTANMSVLGLYKYDNTLFSGMAYPEAFSADDKSLFVDNLLMETAELEILYTSPDFMKLAISRWSAKELPTWERLYSLSQMEYNPIENYDRYESETVDNDGSRRHTGTDTITNSGTDTVTNSGTDTVTNSGTDTVTNSGTDTVTNSGTDTVTNSGKDTTKNSGQDSSSSTGSNDTHNTGTDTTTNTIATYDSDTMKTHDTSALLHGHVSETDTTENVTVTHGLQSELTHGHVEATQHGLQTQTAHGHVEATQHGMQSATQHGEIITDDFTTERESHIHGNIGVRSSQELAEQEIALAPKLNIINYMIDSFKNRFCILVY